MTCLEAEVEVLQTVNYLRFLYGRGILTAVETREAISQIAAKYPGSAAGLVCVVRLDMNPF